VTGLTKELDKLERALLRARRRPRTIIVSDGWNESVMNDVRRIGPLVTEQRASFASLAHTAWRFSAAAGLAALALLVYNLINGFVDYGELALIFLEDPSAFII
jgi:hypothetical protein